MVTTIAGKLKIAFLPNGAVLQQIQIGTMEDGGIAVEQSFLRPPTQPQDPPPPPPLTDEEQKFFNTL